MKALLLGALLCCEAAAQEQLAFVSVEIIGAAPAGGLGIERQLLPYPLQSLREPMLGASNLSEVLTRELPGVNVNEVSGSPFQNDVTYRGFRASPVLGSAQGLSVYLDGVRVNEPFGDVINWDMIPEAAIGSVVLVPGSNPLFGLNTLGGALALATRSAATHPGGTADLSVGGDGRRRANLAYGQGPVYVAGTLFKDRGWREHSDGQLGNLFLKAAGERWSLALLGGRSRLRGNGLLPDAMAAENWRASYTFPDQTRNQLAQATLKVTQPLAAASELAWMAYARSSRRNTVNGDVEEEGEGVLNTSSTRQRGHGGSVNLSLRGGAHRIDAGLALDRSRIAYAQFAQEAALTPAREVIGDDDDAPVPASSVTGAARAFGLYGADTWSVAPRTHVSASLRWNHARVANTLTSARGLQAPERFSYRSLNPALGLVHQHGPWSVYGNLARSNRVPTVIELGCADPEQPCQLPVGLQSDPYLKQVIARTAEAGLRWEQGGSRWSLALFRTANRDDILFLNAGATRLGYFANVGRTLHRGADLAASGRAAALALRASYSYLDATYDSDGALFTGARAVKVGPGTPIAGLPRHTVKLAIDWRVAPGWMVGADAQAVSSLAVQGNEDGAYSAWRIGGHGLLNLKASWRPSPGWECYARISNLLDRRYQSFGALAPNMFADAELARFMAPGAPRSIAGGVKLVF